MSNLIDEILAARDSLRAAEDRATDASRQLRSCKASVEAAKTELDLLLDELKTGQSRYPLLERFAPNGEAITHDEHQRGPTAFEALAPPIRVARTRGKRGGK
jgi:hypothetical protein